MLGSGGGDVSKMDVLELRVQTIFQMFKWFFPLFIRALKMKPDGLCSRRRKFQKIVIFVRRSSDAPPDHMGARTPKKCTPTILKSSVARPFL